MSKVIVDRNEILMTLDLAEGQTRLEGVQLMPIGTWKHPRGIIQITAARARKFAESFKAKIAGQDLPILYIHSDKENISNPKYGEAAGWVTNVIADDERGVLVDIEFTEEGAAAVRGKKYRYLSAEYFNKVQLPHHDRPHEDVIVGAALVNKPHLKGMDPILNSETGHLLVSEVGDTDKGGGPMDPILVQLAKLAGIKLSEDAEALTDDEGVKIKEWAEGLNKSVSDSNAKISLLEKRLEDLEDDGDKETRTLREAGFEEEAILLNEYRADKAVRKLSEDIPSGQVLTPVAETHMRDFVLENDQKALGELLKLAFEGKATVDLVERGTHDADDDTNTDTEVGDELVSMATKRAKENEISFSDAMDLVAAEEPEKWNQYQLSMGSQQATVGGS